MTDSLRKRSRGSGTLASAFATAAALIGCCLTSVYLVLGGTSSLALSEVSPLVAWPYILGFALAAMGILLSASQPLTSQHHVVVTIGAGVLGLLTLPIAWLYFGFAGIGVGTEEQVLGIMAAFIASVLPVVMVFVGGVISWRTVKGMRRDSMRMMTWLVLVSVAVGVGCILFARLAFPGSGAI